MRLLTLLLIAPLSFAASRVERPSVGFALSRDGGVRRVSGISGAFIMGPAEHTGAMAAAFSGTLGVVKLASTIRVLDAAGAVLSESAAPDGEALFGFDSSGDAAAVWYEASSSLRIYRGGGWEPVPVDSLDGVLAVALEADCVLVLIAPEQLVLVRLRVADGAVEQETVVGPGSGPALLLSNGAMLFRREDALVYRNGAGVEQQVTIPPDAKIVRMNRDWAQITTAGGQNMALRLADPVPTLFELPEGIE